MATQPNDLREMIKKYRKYLGISQGELATTASISRPTITNFENGISDLAIKTTTSVKNAFRVIVANRIKLACIVLADLDEGKES